MIGLVLVACAAFGALDQYSGSLTRFWALAWEVPALSAPWLLLPFVVGTSQRGAWRAAVVGGLGTLVALVGFEARNQFFIVTRHPEFGRVTLEQLLVCWVTHDLAHVAQIARVLVRHFGERIGPWTKYFSLLRDR